MPSNKELTEDILALAPTAEVEGLKGAELAALLKQLRADKKATPVIDLSAPKEDEPQLVTSEQIAEDNAPVTDVQIASSPEPEPEPRVYIVAEGRAITSKRGILGPGTEVRPEYFVNGDEVIAELVKKGTLK